MNRLAIKLNIRNALISYLLLGIVLPVCLFGVFFTLVMSHTLKKNAYSAAKQAMETSSVQMDSLISGISYTASYIISNSSVLKNIQAIETDPVSANAMWGREFLIRYMRGLSNVALYAYNPDVSIITTSGVVVGVDYIQYLGQSEISRLFSNTVFGDNFSIWHDPLRDAVSADLVSYWTIRDHGDMIALLRISIPESPLWDLLANHTLLQHHLEVHYRDEPICIKNFDSGAYANPVVYSLFLRNWNMTLEVTVPAAAVEKDLAGQVFLLAVFLLLLLLLLLTIILRVSDQISKPICRIVTQMRHLQEGDTSLSPIPESYREVRLLSETLNELAIRIDGLIQKAAQEATRREQIYYETLMAQINPHFLYNTLNSIKWMAIINGNSAVAEMLVKLGNNLRYSFDSKSSYVTVEKELMFLKDYFALLQMRFGNGITFIADIPPELLRERIPRFCIQPFIENAVSHGFDGTTQGKIILTAAESEDQLIFKVIDNGVGMDPEIVRAQLEELGKSATSTGLGIRNVQQRIQLLFGPRFGLKIQSQPGAGCTVIIRLPMQ